MVDPGIPCFSRLLVLLLGVLTLVHSKKLSNHAIVQTWTLTSTQYSTTTVGYTASAAMDPNCHMGFEKCNPAFVTIPIISTITEYVASTVTSTVGYSVVTVSSDAVPVVTMGPGAGNSIPNAASQTTDSPTTDTRPTSATGHLTAHVSAKGTDTEKGTSTIKNSAIKSPSGNAVSTAAASGTNSASTASTTSNNGGPVQTSSSERIVPALSGGQKTGIAIGILIAVAIIAAVAFLLGRRTSGKKPYKSKFNIPYFLGGKIEGGDNDLAGSQTQLAAAAEKHAERLSPVDRTTPVDRNSPIDRATPVDRNSPIDHITPVDRKSPIDRTTPVDRNSPIDRTTPVDRASPISRTSPVERTSPVPPASGSANDLTDLEFAKAFFSRPQKSSS